MKIGKQEFDTEHQTYIMGILNVTPDSFSDGGKYNRLDKALYRAEEMLREGAAILDVGGESTRPGYTKISDEEEIQRTAPVIEALTAAESGAACCLMHNRQEAVYGDFMKEVAEDLMESVGLARAAGVADDRIILDPGVGFAKSYEQNLEVIARLEELCRLGFPVLLGTSRKSVIGRTLDLPADQRVEGTLVTTVYGVQKGCAFVRVHDIKENRRAVQMTRALMRG